jgi:hypothetical protein
LAALIIATIIACQTNETTGPRDILGLASGVSAAQGSSKGQEAQCDTILITAPTVNITVGGTVQFTANPYSKSDKLLDKATVTWASFNVSVAAVNSAGLVTGVSSGSTIIRATCSATPGVGDLPINVQ